MGIHLPLNKCKLPPPPPTPAVILLDINITNNIDIYSMDKTGGAYFS